MLAREIVAKLRMNDKKGISVPTDDPHFTNHYPVSTGLLRSQKSWSKFDGLFTLQMNKEKIQTTPGVSIFFLIFIFDRLFQPIIDWSYKDSHKLIRKMEVTCPLF